jgi:acetyl esterase/lipase
MKFLIGCLLSLVLMNQLGAQDLIPLYKGIPPGNRKADNRESGATEGGILRISNISIPTLQVFLPDSKQANGTAVIVCPGGGYWINAYAHEGVDVARELNKAGVTAFVLKYRIPDDSVMDDKTIAPLQDAQQAIKLVRDNAAKWNVDVNKLGILGFSAGGHLASTAGTKYSRAFIENTSNTNLRPDFMILVYPVISFSDEYGHKGSRDKLLGLHPTDSLVRLYSNELQVTKKTPPAFLVHATNDDGVPVLNSIRFYEALLKHHVPAEMHLYQGGGHGFGLVNPSTNEKWMDRCINWLDSNGWLKK